jgi:hypothetical protein
MMIVSVDVVAVVGVVVVVVRRRKGNQVPGV